MYKPNPYNLSFEMRMPNGKWQAFMPLVMSHPHLPWRRMTTIVDVEQENIREGDILEFDMPTGFGSNMPTGGVMVWSDADAAFVIALFTRNSTKSVVGGLNFKRVGNIWDNPEKITEFTERFGECEALKD